MSSVLVRLLQEDLDDWYALVSQYEQQNLNLPVPQDNSVDSLHQFNCDINELYTKAYYDYARARRNKDGLERLIDNVLKDLYPGKNELERKAAGIQFAKHYPARHGSMLDAIDLFELEDHFSYFYHSLEATIQTLKAKAESKITNNSLLKIEKNMI